MVIEWSKNALFNCSEPFNWLENAPPPLPPSAFACRGSPVNQLYLCAGKYGPITFRVVKGSLVPRETARTPISINRLNP